MLDLKNILVANDFSKGSGYAILYGVYLAKRTDSLLHNVHVNVLHPDFSERPEEYQSTSRKDLEKRLREVEGGNLPNNQGFDPWGLEVQSKLLQEVAAAPAILEYVQENNIDLVIMGTHGRRGVRRLLIGSVASEVVRKAPCPVLTIGEKPIPAGTDTILVPVDFSKHSKMALRYANDLAEMFGATIDLLHVVEEKPYPAFYTKEEEKAKTYDQHPDIQEKAKNQLRALYSEVGGASADTRYHTVSGQPAHQIAEFADTNNSDLVVMSTHGRTGLKRMLIGSVTDKVVQQAPCPVFTVKTLEAAIKRTSQEAAQKRE